MDLNDLLSSLSDEDMQQLQQTAAQLLGNMQSPQTDNADTQNEAFAGNNPLFDPKLLGGLSKYFGQLNQKDRNSDFLYALRPLLSESKRPKVDEAVNILRVCKMINMLRDGGLLG